MNVNRNQSKIIWNKKGAGLKEKQKYLIEFKCSKGVKPHEGPEDHREAGARLTDSACRAACLYLDFSRQVSFICLSLWICFLCVSVYVTKEATL